MIDQSSQRVDTEMIGGPTLAVRGHRRSVTVIEPPRSGLVSTWRDIWRYRRFSAFFGRTFLHKLSARTWLGWLWIPLRPAFSVLARILVFGGLIGISSRVAPYPLLFLVATAGWQLFFECARWATRSIELNRNLLRVIHVPKPAIVVAAIVPSFLDFLIYCAFVAAAVVYYFVRADVLYIHIGVETLLLPAGLLLLVTFGLGVGFLTATLAASARDVRFGTGYILSFVYFFTPVIYPITAVPHRYRPLAELNPITGALEMVKSGLFENHEVSSDAILVSAVAAAAIWIPGLWFSRRREIAALARE